MFSPLYCTEFIWFFLAETNGSVKNGEESNGDRKRKTEGEEEIPSKKAKVDEDEDDDIGKSDVSLDIHH